MALEDFPDLRHGRWGSKGTVEFSLRVVSITVITIGILTPWGARGPEFWRGVLFGLMYGVAFGLIVALLSVFLAPRNEFDNNVVRIGRILAGDPAIVIEPPAGATHRLIGSLYDEGTKWTVPGALYVTPRGLIFQSHVQGWVTEGDSRRPRYQTAELFSLTTLRVELGRFVRRDRLSWIRKHPPQKILICRSEEGQIVMFAARLDRVVRQLQDCIQELRVNAARASAI